MLSGLKDFTIYFCTYCFTIVSNYTTLQYCKWLQGCCLMGAQSPEAPTIYPQATKISNKEPGGVPKAYDSQAKFW